MTNRIYHKNISIAPDEAKDAVVRIGIGDDELIQVVFFEQDDGSLFYRVVELTDDDDEYCIENTLPEYWDRF